MSDSADPFPSQPPLLPSAAAAAAARPDPDMPPRKGLAGSKLRKPLTDKLLAAAGQRLERLRARLLVRPMEGPVLRALPSPHEDALRALGLLDFVRLGLAAEAPRPDLVAPLVAYYDPSSKRSFVRGVRIAVSRSDLARALGLPTKAISAVSAAPPGVDPAVVVSAVTQLLQDYVLLPFQGDDMCILPQEVAAAEQAVREGSAHKVDWPRLIWSLVEKEMLELPNRDDCVCYYGPYLQRLIRSQKPDLFELVEEADRGEIAPEASVDVVKEEDGGADVKSKSLEELELGNDDVGADARSQHLEEPENADAKSNGVDELESGNADIGVTILEESGSGDVDAWSRYKQDRDKQLAAVGQRLERLRARLLVRPLEDPGLQALSSPHEDALRALGLLDFVRLGLAAEAPRPDLVAPLVAYYDPYYKRSFVRGVHITVSHSDLARALWLPTKAVSTVSAAPPDVDPAVVISAVMQLLQDYVLLPFRGDDMCILPQEVAAAEQAVREGSAHKVDWSRLIWGLVQKEMLELPNRDDCVCYYGPYLQRLIRMQKPDLFELVEEEDRGEIALEASVDVVMEEDGGADVKIKSLEELDLGNDDVGADVRSQHLEEPENADARNNGVDELESGNADVGDTILEESGSGDVDARSRNMEKLEGVNEESSIKGLGDSEAVAEDERINCLDEPEVGEEYTKAITLDELDNEDHAKGEKLDEMSSGFVAAQAVPDANDMVPADNEDETEMAPVRGDDVAVPAEEVVEGFLAEAVVTPHMETVAVPQEVLDEEAEGEEDIHATGLSLGLSSTNGYDSADLQEENVENLDEGDSGSEEAEESEDDGAFEECKDGDDMNWRMGDGKDDGRMTHCLQQSNSSAFGSMQFENLNKGDAEIRDELRFDDFSGRGSLERMTSSNLIQAMNSIPVSYDGVGNVHDLSSGEFLAIGADANKDGMDLGPGSSYLFGNNGKRHIGDIDGYNGNMQAQEQFPRCNQQKRMRHGNSSSIAPGPSDFNSNFMVPIQNLMVEASKFYEQKDQEVQSLQMEKQYFADMLQEKDALIQSLNSARFEQENRWQAQLRRFEHDLNVMAQLVTGYRKALKQTRASFDEYRKKFPCNKPRYEDVPDGGGLVLPVRELERRRLEAERQKLAAANDLIEKFEQEWFSKLNDSLSSVHSLSNRMEELSKEIHLIRETRKAKLEAPASEE